MTVAEETLLPFPAGAEAQAAKRGRLVLEAALANRRRTQQFQFIDEGSQVHQVELPSSAVRLLVDILGQLAEGHAVKVVSVHEELTTQEAADLLKVSRPHMVKLLEEGTLPFHRTGKHRRVKLSDVMAHKAAREQASSSAMAELARQAQELQLGYE